MAQLTRDQIVSEGQLLAGRDDNATASNGWLQRWLDSVAASYVWPVLQTETIGISVPSGSTSLVLGNGSGGITEKVIKPLDNIWLYDSTRVFRRRLRIRHQLSAPIDRIGPSNNVGTPNAVRGFNSSFGVWTLYFDVTPNQDYLLTFPYIRLPAAIVTGSEIPWYPSDETMVQLVCFKNLEFYNQKDDPQTLQAQQMLAGLLNSDRLRYGSTVGINNKMILDPTVFPRAAK